MTTKEPTIEEMIAWLDDEIPCSSVRHMLEAIRAALLAATQWQPIETAPRDGTVIWVCRADHYLDNGFMPQSGFWGTYHPNAKGEACWRDINRHKIGFVTHWMRVAPQPPKDSTVPM